MKKNIGKVDKVIRFLVGFLAILAVLVGSVTGAWENILLILGALLLITASINFCPLYALFRMKTLK